MRYKLLVKPIFVCALALTLGTMLCVGCKKGSGGAKTEEAEKEALSPEIVAAAAQLKESKDSIAEEIHALHEKIRAAFDGHRYDEMEQSAAEARTAKTLYGNGSWKILQFYDSFGCVKRKPESQWEIDDRMHQDWIAAQPASLTARVAYADFLTDYAWHARGSGYSDTVTRNGWQLFADRLAASRKVLEEARSLPEKDPVWWMVMLRVALGQGWEKREYDALVAEATTFEPTFWGYDTTRSYSLLPRWHGEPGDWEAYAAQAMERPGGLGAETYARIAIYLRQYYDELFRETKASWPNARAGLEILRQKYPDSIELLSQTALLAVTADDFALGKEMFDRLGDTYLESVWDSPERFIWFRNAANGAN